MLVNLPDHIKNVLIYQADASSYVISSKYFILGEQKMTVVVLGIKAETDSCMAKYE